MIPRCGVVEFADFSVQSPHAEFSESEHSTFSVAFAVSVGKQTKPLQSDSPILSTQPDLRYTSKRAIEGVECHRLAHRVVFAATTFGRKSLRRRILGESQEHVQHFKQDGGSQCRYGS